MSQDTSFTGHHPRASVSVMTRDICRSQCWSDWAQNLQPITFTLSSHSSCTVVPGTRR